MGWSRQAASCFGSSPLFRKRGTHPITPAPHNFACSLSQRTRAALAAAKVRGTKLGNPRLPATGTLAAAPQPSTPGRKARVASAQARAVAAYGPAIQAARSAGALSLGDYAQALQSARLPAPRGGDRWSRPSVARILRYRKDTVPARL